MLALNGCRPALTTYYVAGWGERIYVRSSQVPIATFKGNGSWEVSVVAQHVPAGENSPSETRRVCSPVNDRLKILLEEFLPPDGAPADGRFTFTFALLGVQAARSLPPCKVTLDQTPPSLFRLVAQPEGGVRKVEITGEADAFLRDEDRMKIQVDDLSPCKVLINGTRAIPYEDGSYHVPISGGPEIDLQVDATDAAGNRQLVTQTIRLDREDPVIELPGKSQKVVFDKQATLNFAVADDTAVELVACRLNGVQVPTIPLPDGPLSEGRYSVTLHFQSGWNEVIFEAYDKTGRHSVKKHRVEYDPSMTRVVGTITGADRPVHTTDPLAIVASFEGPEDQEIFAVASVLAPGRDTPKEITRQFRVKNRKLQIRLSDFSAGEQPVTDGRFSLDYSTLAGDSAEELRQGVVYLDRKRPEILLEAMDAHGNEIEKPVDGQAEIFVRGDDFKVHVVDESSPELSINGVASVFSGNGIYRVPTDSDTVELRATDLAGNSTAAILQLRRDGQEPRIDNINVDGSVDDKDFELEFRAADDTQVVGVAVTLNGQPVAIADRDADLCRASLSLRRGPNEIVIQAWDRSWRKTVATRTLTLEAPTASNEITREGGVYVLLIGVESGKREKWALSDSVTKIESAPPVKNRFTVTTASDPDVPMLLVRGGSFPLQGNEETTVEEPPFLIECYEVDVKRFSGFQRSKGSEEWIQRLPGEFRDPEQPAVVVDWGEATAFASWAGKELPTARQHSVASAWDGKRYRRYPWGDDFAAGGLPTKWQPHPPKVNVATGDRSPWGVIGLAGGVREWCLDKAPYKPSHRLLRGGSQVHPRGGWRKTQELTPAQFLSTREGSAVRSSKMNDVGFRCVLRLSPMPRGKIAGGRREPGER